MDERERIAALTERFRCLAPSVRLGIGDDAAVLRLGGDLVTTVDTAVEGTHFRRSWAALDLLSRRAFVAAVSDLAAMGAEPRGALISLILPGTLDDIEFESIIAGLSQAAEELECPVVGGNLSEGGELSITTTAIGVSAGDILVRGGARRGDVLYITGPPGDRALGLHVLLSERSLASEEAQQLATSWLVPEARIAAGRALLGRAASAIDISDGLLSDLDHICRASGVGALVNIETLPRHNRFDEVAAMLEVDPLKVLLTGGEAYELLFTAPPEVDVRDVGIPIGSIVDGPGVVALDRGSAIELGGAGFVHFR